MRKDLYDAEETGKQEEKGRRRKILAVVKGAVAFLAAITALSSVYVVDQTEQAVVTRFGKPVKVVLNPLERKGKEKTTGEIEELYTKEGIKYSEGAGLKLKLPFVDRVTKFDRRLLRWNGYSEDIPTKDKKYIFVDTTARAHVEDPLKFMKTGGAEYQFHSRLDDIIDAATRNAITQRDLIEVVRTDNREMRISEQELRETIDVGKVKEGRPKIVGEITEKSKESCREYGIGVYDQGVLVKGLVYVEQVKTAVEERMKAERYRIAEKYRSEGDGEFKRITGQKEKEVMRIRSEAYKKAREIEGTADAEATKVYADAFNRDPEFYQFIRSLQLYEETLPGKATKLIMGIDSPLLRMLRGEIKPKEQK